MVVDLRKLERFLSAVDERRSPKPPLIPNTLKRLNSNAVARFTPFKGSLNVGYY